MLKWNKWNKLLFLFSLFLLLTIIFIAIFFLVNNYIHESGHIIYGIGDGLFKGRVNHFEIRNWISHPFLPFIKLPQRIKPIGDSNSLNFAFGGPIFSILVFFGLSLFAFKRSRDKKWFLLFASILLFELSGNFVCGTDNWINEPLSICNRTLDLAIQWGAILLFSGTWSYFSIKRVKNIVF